MPSWILEKALKKLLQHEKLWPPEQNLNLVHLPENIFESIFFLRLYHLISLYVCLYMDITDEVYFATRQNYQHIFVNSHFIVKGPYFIDLTQMSAHFTI